MKKLKTEKNQWEDPNIERSLKELENPKLWYERQIREIRELVKDIDPETSILDREGELLYKLASQVPEGQCIVEIGSWLGRSTIWLAKGAKPGVKIYAIDPHRGTDTHEVKGIKETFEQFRWNIAVAGVSKKVVPIRKTSLEAFKEFGRDDIGLLFIDGSHNLENVLEDYENWLLKISYKGYIVFHDTIGYKGPKWVVNNLIFKSFVWEVTDIVGQIVAARFKHGRQNWSMWMYWKIYSWLFLLATKLPRGIKEKLK